MIERIKRLMEEQHLNQQAFAATLGISPASLSSIFNGRTQPSLNHVQAILKKYPYINPLWLLDGTGNMRKDDAMSPTSTSTATPVGDPQAATQVSSATPGANDASQTAAIMAEQNNYANRHTSQPSSTPIAQQSIAALKLMAENIPPVKTRKITEIRIFYDDMTWEDFVPKEKKDKK